jgi:hypothetical protein
MHAERRCVLIDFCLQAQATKSMHKQLRGVGKYLHSKYLVVWFAGDGLT